MWKKLTQHQKNTRMKIAIFFILGSWFAIESMGISDYVVMAALAGAIFGVSYMYKYIRQRL